MRLKDRWQLFVYNWLRLPWQNWWFKRRYMREWIAEGRDPARFPVFGRMDLSDLDWARAQITERTRWRRGG